MRPFLDKVAHHLGQALKGRKVVAYCLTSALISLCGVFVPPAALTTVVGGLVAVYATLCASHAATDLKAIGKTEPNK